MVFRELLHNTFDLVTEEILMERIFCAFDRLCDGVIHLDEWVLGLSCFLRGTNEELIKFTFLIYDLNNDGFITREEMFQLLRYGRNQSYNRLDLNVGTHCVVQGPVCYDL